MILISSRNHPKIKQARLLRQRKSRQESDLFVVEADAPWFPALRNRARLTMRRAPLSFFCLDTSNGGSSSEERA